MTPRIFLDLDGVLADFDAHYAKLFGHYHKAIPDDELWANIHAMPDFFRGIPPFPQAGAFFRSVTHLLSSYRPLDVSILTACPKSAYAHVARQKREWVREHISEHVTVIPAPGGSAKPIFMHAPGDILVDDFKRNTDAWEKAGGRAILHTGDLGDTFEAVATLVGASPL